MAPTESEKSDKSNSTITMQQFKEFLVKDFHDLKKVHPCLSPNQRLTMVFADLIKLVVADESQRGKLCYKCESTKHEFLRFIDIMHAEVFRVIAPDGFLAGTTLDCPREYGDCLSTVLWGILAGYRQEGVVDADADASKLAGGASNDDFKCFCGESSLPVPGDTRPDAAPVAVPVDAPITTTRADDSIKDGTETAVDLAAGLSRISLAIPGGPTDTRAGRFVYPAGTAPQYVSLSQTHRGQHRPFACQCALMRDDSDANDEEKKPRGRARRRRDRRKH